MANYYVDGTISSVSGTGSGTLADPWGKDDDLYDYALNEIKTGPGIGANGDVLIVVDGGFKNTVPHSVTGWSSLKPLITRPLVMDGTQRIPFDLNFRQLTELQNRTGREMFFCDFVNFPPSGIGENGIYFSNRCGLYYCSFESGGPCTTMVKVGAYTNLIGNRWFNDQRTTGLLLQGTQGCLYDGNLFEPVYNGYAVYSYAGCFTRNVIIIQAGLTYNTGLVLPIDSGQFIQNTFYSISGKGSGFYIPNSYEKNVVINNYFENLYRGVNMASNAHDNLVQLFCGNRGYSLTSGLYPSTINTDAVFNIFENNEELTTSGVVDAANFDFRPNSQLIAQGWQNRKLADWLPEIGENPTIGAIQSRAMVQRIRDIY